MQQYQTLDEFLREPFGRQDLLDKITDYESRYQIYLRDNKIRLVAYTEVEGSYYLHVTVPSESAKEESYRYDVVLRFFTTSDRIRKESSLRNYYVQFFSNSPSFIYKYAVLYKKHGALIEFLYSKMNPEYADTLPEKSNKAMEISFDKSIYFATRYLSQHKFRYLTKMGILLQKKRSQKVFFAGIRDFETVKLERMLIAEEKKLQKEEKRDSDRKRNAPPDTTKKNAIQDTLRDQKDPRIHVVTKTTAKKATSGINRSTKVGKKTARKTTYRKI